MLLVLARPSPADCRQPVEEGPHHPEAPVHVERGSGADAPFGPRLVELDDLGEVGRTHGYVAAAVVIASASNDQIPRMNCEGRMTKIN